MIFQNGLPCMNFTASGFIDSQSVRRGLPQSVKGIDGGKKIKGIKRHLAVDSNIEFRNFVIQADWRQVGCGTYLFLAWVLQKIKQKLRTVSSHLQRDCNGGVCNVYVALRIILQKPSSTTYILCSAWHKLPSPRPIVIHLRPLVSVTMQPHCSLTARTHLHDSWPPQC